MITDSRLEERYLVVKLKSLTDVQTLKLRRIIEDFEIPTVDCVVVEADWPQYKATVDSVLNADCSWLPKIVAWKADNGQWAPCEQDAKTYERRMAVKMYPLIKLEDHCAVLRSRGNQND